jgi:hypothetical protein
MATSSRRALLALGVWSAAAVAGAATRYVDPLIGSASCTTYNPASRSCGSGTALGYRTIAGAAAVAVAGDVVYLRGGTYGEALAPAASGMPAQPITYARYQAETPIITGGGLDPAIEISDRSHIVIDGLTVQDVTGWLRGQNTHYCVVRNGTFLRATAGGSRAGLKFIDATFNRVVANRIDAGNDNVGFIHSDRNVLEGNQLTQAGHQLWYILCGNFNVIRNNSFHNALQKIGQVTDCEGTPSGAPVLFNATKYNLVEGNTFEYTPSSGNASPYAGIQYAAQKGLIRRNRFYDTVGPALDLTLYDDEARFNTDNRVYHNVFHSTDFAGVSLASGTTFSGNVFKNNVLSRSVFVANDTRWPFYTDELAGKPVQLFSGRLDGFLFEGNDILGSAPAQLYAITYGVRTQPAFSQTPQALSWWQANHPTLFRNNREQDPLFVDEAAHDYRLRPLSPLIDAGVFLARAAAAGSGTSLPVDDATWFFDGFGIPGEVGDLVQLQGQTVTARVTAINYTTNTLMLDRALTFSAGQGVALAYSGSAPDVGAFETTGALLSVADVAVPEGDTGPVSAVFTVSLSAAAAQVVSVDFATADGTATTAGGDYAAAGGSLSFAPGTTARTITVTVSGDAIVEPHETFTLTLSNALGAPLADGQAVATILDDEAARYYTVLPCRLLDTRQPAGPSGGPILTAGERRSFPVAGACSVPAGAKAAVLNVTAVAPTLSGNLRLYPAGLAPPATSIVNFAAGRTRANNGLVLLGSSGFATVQLDLAGAGQAHVVVDVFGYYQSP